MIGGNSFGDGRPAIIISDDFRIGFSDHCETFDNTVLCGG